MPEPRLTHTSVTNFLYYGDEYLMLHRAANKSVDANRLNGVGGKLEPGEDFLTAAIRETEEETGYVVKPEQIKLCGITKLEGGYKEDWIFCVFKIEVSTKEVPKGFSTDDGEFMWMHKDDVLQSKYELVDDLRICFPEVIKDESVFFIHEYIDENEKVKSHTIAKLPLL